MASIGRSKEDTEFKDGAEISTGFGLFIVKVASLLAFATVRKLAMVLNFSPADIDEVERDPNPSYVFMTYLKEKGIISQTDVSLLISSLKDIKMTGVANEVLESFIKYKEQSPSTDSTTEIQEKTENFVQKLKRTYEYFYNKVQPNPYIRDRLQCVNRVFIDSGIEYLNKEGGSNIEGRWEKLDSYQSLFNDPRLQHATMFLLYGEPGYGKSTLALQYVYDWCNHTPGSPLKDIPILLYLPLRQVQGFASILMAIKQLLLPRESNLSERDIREIILSCKSVLILFDGLDEYSYPDDKNKDDVTAILTRKMFQDIIVIVTTRPSCTPSNLAYNAKQIRLSGFDEAARQSYILKAVVDGNTESAVEISQRLQKNPVLADICQVPLLFVMFAHMTHEKDMSQVFDSVTSFFRYVVSCLYEHTQIRRGAENATIQGTFQTQHNELYRFAFESLQRKDKTLVWRREALMKRIGETLYNELVEIGILVEENVLRIVDDPGTTAADHIQRRTVSFYHKLFCEWYAAHYVTDHIIRTETSILQKIAYWMEYAIGLRISNLHRLLKDMDPLDLQYMFRFACGISPAAADRVIHYLHNIEGGDKFAVLCILEKNGQVDKIMVIIRQICSEGVIISGHESLLLQRSSMQLLEIAEKHDIPVYYVRLDDCFQTVDISAEAIRTISGMTFSSRIPVEGLQISLFNREITEDETIAILEFSAMCPSLSFLRYQGCVPPRSFQVGSTLSMLNSRNVSVQWLWTENGHMRILDLQSGRWKNKSDGSEPTEEDFQRMLLTRDRERHEWTEEAYRNGVKGSREMLRKAEARRRGHSSYGFIQITMKEISRIMSLMLLCYIGEALLVLINPSHDVPDA